MPYVKEGDLRQRILLDGHATQKGEEVCHSLTDKDNPYSFCIRIDSCISYAWF